MKRDNLERKIHMGIVDLLRFNARQDCVYFHVANERRTSPAEGAFLKRMGVLAGVPDFIFIIPQGVFFLEIKRPGKDLSETQRAFRDAVVAMGYCHSVAYSIDGAKEILSRWHVLKRTAEPQRKAA